MFLDFLPILAFLSGTFLIYKFAPKKSNTGVPLLLLISFITYILTTDIDILFYIVQGVAGILLFFLMVLALGNKTSLGTILTVSGVIMLSPGGPGLIALVLSLLCTLGYGVLSIMRSQGRTIQQVSLELAANSGIMGMSTPDISSVPDRKEVQSNEKVFNIAPYFFFPYLLVALIVLVL